MSGVIVAGDIGGTKTHLGLFHCGAKNSVSLAREQVYPTSRYRSLEDVCADFMSGHSEKADAACFGVAGPVINKRSAATNIPWEMEEASLGRALGGIGVRLLNDLEATAYGILHLEPSELAILQGGEASSSRSNMAVIAAGTGLGEAILVAEPQDFRAVPSEGGHCDFAPRGEEQQQLLSFLSAEFGHVSFERILSGPGLFNIYRFLKRSMPDEEPPWLAARLGSEDPAAVVSEAAIAGSDHRSARTLEIFADIYGAEASNLALKSLALGGVYLGGGIAPKILPILKRGGFIAGFCDKGRLAPLMAKIPVRVSLNQSAALIGAAHQAAAML